MAGAARPVWIAVAILGAFAAVLWLPALHTPFWADDYHFLIEARAANLAGEPLWSAFVPEVHGQFWRPLSHQTWWRFVESALGGDARRTHFGNLAFLLIAAASVGLLSFTLARACRWGAPGAVAGLAGALYAVLALHLLAVHWASAANSSVLAAFTALSLAAWVAAGQASGRARAVLFGAALAFLVAALMSKEAAIMTPLLMAVLTVFVAKPVRRAEIVVWILAVCIVVMWLLLRVRFTSAIPPAYALNLGDNLVRNGVSFAAWMLNVPREALRMILLGDAGPGLLWAVATAVPVLWVWTVAARKTDLGRRRWFMTAAFALAAYAPYFPMAWNSYAYYAAVAAILPVIALARGLLGSRRVVLAAALVGLSSWVAVAGTRWLDHPALIGRARWAESTLQALSQAEIPSQLSVRVEDSQRFFAIGIDGLAWRLNRSRDSIHLLDDCGPAGHGCLVFHADGRVSWVHR